MFNAGVLYHRFLLQLFPEAELAFMQVLKLDKNCEDALHELIRVRTCQLTEMGFTSEQANRALQQFGSVQLALDSLLAGFGKPHSVSKRNDKLRNLGILRLIT